MTTTIISVTQQPSGLFVIRDRDGVRYATKSALLASLADRHRAAETPVELFSVAGWYYRELWSIHDPAAKAEPQALICSWCDTVQREGTRPATHTICPTCFDQMDSELSAKYGHSAGATR